MKYCWAEVLEMLRRWMQAAVRKRAVVRMKRSSLRNQ